MKIARGTYTRENDEKVSHLQFRHNRKGKGCDDCGHMTAFDVEVGVENRTEN